ncbi:MAG: universal stress protein [Actinobacteria bacterium]|nr:universal stress protein [Actinomycetota bacterium]MBU1866326.1 universal stress protein [Actinomycetota bacterium]
MRHPQSPTDGARTTIVVGYTTQEPGRAALEKAIAEAILRDAELVVVHSTKGGPATEHEIQHLHEHEEALADIDRRLTEAGIDHRVRKLVRGMSPAEDLAAAVNDEGASLLVVGYTHRSRTSKALLGSDIQQILLQAPCPVLAVRPDHR